MASKARDNFSDRILAVVQPGDSSARVLLLSLDGSDLTLLAATSSPVPVQRTLDELSQKHGRGRELRIVPGPRSVCRTGDGRGGQRCRDHRRHHPGRRSAAAHRTPGAPPGRRRHPRRRRLA
jgi:hypothetical protein